MSPKEQDVFQDLFNLSPDFGLSDQFARAYSPGTETVNSINPLDEILNNLLQEDPGLEQYTNSAHITPANRGHDGTADAFDYNPPEEPFVKLIEEPASNLYRFRYRSEGETAGSIPGEKQQNGLK